MMKKRQRQIAAAVLVLILVFLWKKEFWRLKAGPTSPLDRSMGFSFGIGTKTVGLLSYLDSKRDMVDMVGAKIEDINQAHKLGIPAACISTSLPGLEAAGQKAGNGGTKCDYLGYNPEDKEATPQEERDDLVAALTKAREIANQYQSKLLVGPGGQLIERQPELYGKLAGLADAWMIQSQVFQVTKAGQKTTPAGYRANVARVSQALRSGNSQIKIWAQIMIVPGGRKESSFSVEEIEALVESVKDLIDGVRIYYAGDESGVEIIKNLLINRKSEMAVTPIPTGGVGRKKVSDLPIQIATSIKGEMIPYFNDIARDEDVIGFTSGGIKSVRVEEFRRVVSQIKKGKVEINETSWRQAREDVPKLAELIDYLSYDLENWEASGGEGEDIAGSSQKMQQIAHDNGLIYVGGLSYSLGKQPGAVEDSARYADEYAIWAQPFFKRGDLEGFASYAREVAARARSSNPNIKIQLVVNVVWKGYTVGDILDKVITPSVDFVDRVAIYHLTGGQEAENRLKELVDLMR